MSVRVAGVQVANSIGYSKEMLQRYDSPQPNLFFAAA